MLIFAYKSNIDYGVIWNINYMILHYLYGRLLFNIANCTEYRSKVKLLP